MVIYDHEFETKANQGKIEPQHIHLVAYNIRVDRLLIDSHECRRCADSLHRLVPRTVRKTLIQKRAIGSVLTNRITIVQSCSFSFLAVSLSCLFSLTSLYPFVLLFVTPPCLSRFRLTPSFLSSSFF